MVKIVNANRRTKRFHNTQSTNSRMHAITNYNTSSDHVKFDQVSVSAATTKTEHAMHFLGPMALLFDCSRMRRTECI